MLNGRFLGEVAELIIPEYYGLISWNKIWDQRIESGIAFEWAVFFAVISEAKKRNYVISLPPLEFNGGSEYFLIRNEVPITYGSQVGNSATAMHSKPLDKRFFFSLIPKATIAKGNAIYSIFREGCPYHKIMKGINYIDRPDIIFFKGHLTDGYPKFNSSHSEVDFDYECGILQVSGTLRITNSPYIPCCKRTPSNNTPFSSSGIIECSVNKSYEIAEPQCNKYLTLFAEEGERLPVNVVAGNEIPMLTFNSSVINLKNGNKETLLRQLSDASKQVLDNFRLF